MGKARRVLAAISAAALLSSSLAPLNPAVAGAVIAHRPRVAATTYQAGWASSNWSGYAITGSFSSVTGSWVVPSVLATKSATYSSDWVGIDGFNNSSLIQTGTESDYYSGSAHYGVWWEILPAAATFISSMTVHPGDVMAATITKGSSGSWTIKINDTTTGQGFSTTSTYTGPGTSAEWVLEAPTVGGRLATLAHYQSPDLFDPGTANGANPLLTASNGGVMIQKSRQVSTPSNPDSDTDGFNMAYGSTAPAPPSS